MNRGCMLKRYRRFILRYADITKEYAREPEKDIKEYRKGSYFLVVSMRSSDGWSGSAAIGHKDKYACYKEAFYCVKDFLAHKYSS